MELMLGRRALLRATLVAGGGLALGLTPALADEAASGPFAHWVEIAADGTVTITVPLGEIGQGTHTAMPQLVAEELRVPWAAVRVRMAPAGQVYMNPRFRSQSIGGSVAIRHYGEVLRQAGASAREMLVEAAARRWSVPADQCSARDGLVVHAASGRELAYGDLAAEAASLPVPQSPALTAPADWTIIGKSLTRTDTPAKVLGSAIFGSDVRLPGMLFGTVAACPMHGGTLVSVDPAPALALPGVVQVVPTETAVIVVADSTWAAMRGLAALAPEWAPDPKGALDSAMLAAERVALFATPGIDVPGAGDAKAALAGATKTIELEYAVPYLAHATMEPGNATARIEGGKAEIWVGTQSQTRAQATMIQLTGLPDEAVTVHTPFIGGGFGRRAFPDTITYAVQAAQATGKPVQVAWSREEDTRHDLYRPAASCRVQIGLDSDGGLAAMSFAVAGGSIGRYLSPQNMKPGRADNSMLSLLDKPIYPAAAHSLSIHMADRDVPLGYWRSVGYGTNAFFLESAIDEAALAAGADPLAFRRRLLADQPRAVAVLDAVAALSGWSAAPAAGRGRGISVVNAYDSWTAQVVEVSVDADKALRIHGIWCAFDCGRVVNPGIVEAQLTGAIMDALSATLFGRVDFADGATVQGNFDSVRLLLMAETPPMVTQILDSDAPMGGVGESATPPLAPALTAAIAAATGERIRSLPLADHGFRLV